MQAMGCILWMFWKKNGQIPCDYSVILVCYVLVIWDCLSIKMLSYQQRDFHYKDKMFSVSRPSYLFNGNLYKLKWKCPHFWQNFHHWLHWKMPKWQLSVQPVMKISAKWQHYHFSVPGKKVFILTESPGCCHVCDPVVLQIGDYCHR